jgi:hypothetical protein
MGRRVSTGWFRGRRTTAALVAGAVVVSLGVPLAIAPAAQAAAATNVPVSVLLFHGPAAAQ